MRCRSWPWTHTSSAPSAWSASPRRRRVGVGDDRDVGGRVLRRHADDPLALRREPIGERGQAVGVHVQHRGGGHGLLEDLGLGRHDGVEGPHALEVHGADVHDGGHVGLDPAAHRADLAAAERAHLRDEHLGAGRQVLVQGAGEPAGVVEAGRAGQHAAGGADQVAHVQLRRRLAVRPGDGHRGGVDLAQLGGRGLHEAAGGELLERTSEEQRDVDDGGLQEAEQGGQRGRHLGRARRARRGPRRGCRPPRRGSSGDGSTPAARCGPSGSRPSGAQTVTAATTTAISGRLKALSPAASTPTASTRLSCPERPPPAGEPHGRAGEVVLALGDAQPPGRLDHRGHGAEQDDRQRHDGRCSSMAARRAAGAVSGVR